MIKFFSLALLIGLASCASSDFLKREAASHVGCRPADVKVSEIESGIVNSSWVAECSGQEYYCSRSPDSQTSFKVKCSELKK